MKKGLIVIIVLIAIGMLGCGKYNSLVKEDENVKNKWGAVQSQYQRRLDLIPNLVNTVKGAANFEKETLSQVIEARSKATAMNVNANDLSPQKISEFQKVQGSLSSALSRLLAVVENYPQLKANQNFLDLQAQLEGTENRIAVARNDFNNAVKSYNSQVRSFPTNILARLAGFQQKGYFEAQPGSDKAPAVQF